MRDTGRTMIVSDIKAAVVRARHHANNLKSELVRLESYLAEYGTNQPPNTKIGSGAR